MKTYRIEINKVTAMSNGNGLVQARIDALVLPQAVRGDEAETTNVLSMSEATARVMMLLLKAQLAEVDGRKARSQR